MLNSKDFINLVFPKISSLVHNHICCICIEFENSDDNWLNILPAFTTVTEQENAKKFTFKKDSIRHLLGRALIRKTLDIDLVDFSYTEFGKPYLLDNKVFFNISHSGNMLCLALCSCADVGIDIEEIRPIDSLSSKDISNPIFQLHEKEIDFFKSYMEQTNIYSEDFLLQSFYRCWARKESVAKACALGLHLALKSYEVDTNIKDKDWIIQYPHNKDSHSTLWSSYDLKINKKYACSVVALAPNLPLHIISI